ncbi:MAG: hypothetical protein PQJ60_12545 [Spirochaetales bacterium]|nr:hypothetical protein [Spirochaetales bacterium]
MSHSPLSVVEGEVFVEKRWVPKGHGDIVRIDKVTFEVSGHGPYYDILIKDEGLLQEGNYIRLTYLPSSSEWDRHE